MKRFCLNVVLFAFILFLVIVVSVFCIQDNSMKRSMLGMQMVKLERLAKTPGRRIVFLGGSNLSHGLDSPRIERELGLDVINMGLHAGLGLRYVMWSAAVGIHAGDLVVIAPEYGSFGEGFFGSAETLAMVCDIIPEQKRLLSYGQWIRMLEFIPRYGARKYLRLRRCFFGGATPPIANYNKQGDLALRLQGEMPSPFIKKYGKASSKSFRPKTIAEINKFIHHCEQTGATVVFLPPAFQQSSFDNQRELIDTIEKALEANGTPFLVTPSIFAFDDEIFYDTPYHLNLRGMPLRTQLVIEALEPLVSK